MAVRRVTSLVAAPSRDCRATQLPPRTRPSLPAPMALPSPTTVAEVLPCGDSLSQGLKSMEKLNLSGFTKPVVILSTMWNLDVVSALVDGCRTELLRLGLPERLIVNLQVRAVAHCSHRRGSSGDVAAPNTANWLHSQAATTLAGGGAEGQWRQAVHRVCRARFLRTPYAAGVDVSAVRRCLERSSCPQQRSRLLRRGPTL